MNMVTDQAALAADPVTYLSRRPLTPPAATPLPPERLEFGVIIQNALTVMAVAGLLWFQIEIVRCLW